MSHSVSSSSIRALAAVVSVLTVLILGLAAWRFRAWRKSLKVAPSSLITNSEKDRRHLFHKGSLSKFSLKDLELGKKYSAHPVALPPSPPSPDSDDGWFPRLTPWRPPSAVFNDNVNLSAPVRPNRPNSLRLPFVGDVFLRSPSQDVERAITPPPTYYIANGGRSTPSSSVLIPEIKVSAPSEIIASPPPAATFVSTVHNPSTQVPVTRLPPSTSRIAAPPSLKLTIIPPPPPSLEGTPISAVTIASPRRVDSLPNSPARSPARSVPALSILPKTPKSSSSSGSRHNRPPSPKRLPRLVKVVIPFTPLEHDELACNVGDTLRLLEEYEDEWCLVQRVGREDADKGVVPRFCVQDRADVVPSYWGPYFASQGSR